MKRTWLLAALCIVLVSNAAALLHAWHNRTGAPDADIVLTEREVPLRYESPKSDDSGVALRLQWADPINFGVGASCVPPWPAPHNLVSPDQPVLAYVALLNDPTWTSCPSQRGTVIVASGLRPIDADPDPRMLRARHPDRSRVIIVRCTIGSYREGSTQRPFLRDVAADIHVPLPLSERLRGQTLARYTVRLRYGADYEPMVVDIQPR